MQYEVLIVGAGPAGTAVALSLIQAGVTGVALVEAAPPRPWQVGEAATPDVPGLLAQLGLAMPSGHHPYLGNISVWGGPLQREDFAARGWAPGWKLNRAHFDQQLVEAAVHAGIQLLRPVRLERAVRVGEGWQVGLHGPEGRFVVQARFLVDASGKAAVLGHQLGAQRLRVDHQVALVRCVPAKVLTTDLLKMYVWVEACPEGWWYATALPGDQVILSLMSDPDLVQERKQSGPWHTALAPMLSTHLALDHASPFTVRAFPAYSGCLNRAAGRGWLAVGDALLSLDPLTSSGISGALRDGLEATAHVLLPWLSGQDPEETGRAWGARANRSWQRFLGARQQMYDQVTAFSDQPYWVRRQLGRPKLHANE